MKPFRLILGVVLLGYLGYSAFERTLKYSVYSDVANLYWDISYPIGAWLRIPQYLTYGQFMGLVYAIVVIAGIVLILSSMR